MTRGRPQLVSDKPLAQPVELTRKPHWYFLCRRGIHNLGAGVLSMWNSEVETEIYACSMCFLQFIMHRQNERWNDLLYLTYKSPDLPTFWRHKPMSVEMVVSEYYLVFSQLNHVNTTGLQKASSLLHLKGL